MRKPTPKTRPALWTTTFPRQVRSKPEAKAKGIRKVSKAKDPEYRAYKKEAKAFVAAAVQAGKKCPVVATIAELRNGMRYGWPVSAKLTEVHHTRGRAGTLLRDQSHWMAVSKAGHRWIHSNPAAARQHGWLCEPGLWNKTKP